MNKAHYLHKEFPKTCEETDFWGQVKRTIQGKPVDEAQISMIVDKVCSQLALEPAHRLLDLGCGNGALSDRIFAHCAGGLGVDFSEALMAVAQKYFARADRIYQFGDVLEFARHEPAPDRFDRALAYGVFAYLQQETVSELLQLLHRRFTRIQRLFVGNMPDRTRVQAFLGDRPCPPGFEDDPESVLGYWRQPTQFAELAQQAGWRCELSQMPSAYHASHYRFDALLLRE